MSRPWTVHRGKGHPQQPRRVGPDDGFEAAALDYLDSLYGTALRLTRQASDAEDLVQDTYVKAFRFAHTFEPGTNLKAWLFTILHNTFRNRLRQGSRDPVEVDSETVEQAPADSRTVLTPEDVLLRNTLGADLRVALDALPVTFREAVWMRDVEELTYQEIATALGVPIGTVMSRISRGRRSLHAHLTKGNAAASPGGPRPHTPRVGGRGHGTANGGTGDQGL